MLIQALRKTVNEDKEYIGVISIKKLKELKNLVYVKNRKKKITTLYIGSEAEMSEVEVEFKDENFFGSCIIEIFPDKLLDKIYIGKGLSNLNDNDQIMIKIKKNQNLEKLKEEN